MSLEQTCKNTSGQLRESAPDKIESPCIGVCTLEDDICIGCGRSQQEIALWRQFEPERRSRLMEQILPQRLAELFD